MECLISFWNNHECTLERKAALVGGYASRKIKKKGDIRKRIEQTSNVSNLELVEYRPLMLPGSS